MKLHSLAASAALLCLAASAQAANDPAESGAAAKPDTRFCTYDTSTGSHLPRATCLTAQQIRDRENLRKVNATLVGSPGAGKPNITPLRQ